jgi:hypothetical protein
MPAPRMKCPNCQTEFQKRQLRCPKCNEIGVSKLYKYFRYNEHSLEMLTNKHIWFQSAESLNDPFEFRFELLKMQFDGTPINAESLEKAKAEMKKMGFCRSVKLITTF